MLEVADRVASVASAVIGLLGLALAGLSFWWSRRRGPDANSVAAPPPKAPAAEELQKWEETVQKALAEAMRQLRTETKSSPAGADASPGFSMPSRSERAPSSEDVPAAPASLPHSADVPQPALNRRVEASVGPRKPRWLKALTRPTTALVVLLLAAGLAWLAFTL